MESLPADERQDHLGRESSARYRELRGALRTIHEELGVTSVFVTHDQEEAFALTDRVAILNAGRIEQFATAGAIKVHPATDFVREFITE